MTARNEKAFSANATLAPVLANIKPAIAGPTARARLNPALLRATAELNWDDGTTSVMTAWNAGPIRAVPKARAAVKVRRSAGETKPEKVKPVNKAATNIIQNSLISRMRRRSAMSARAPAGRASSTTGRLLADCTIAISNGDPVREVISHVAATACIKLPMLVTTFADHIERNTGCPNGAHADSPFPTTAEL